MVFIIAWTVILLAVLALELYGVFRPGKNDTITETFRYWRDRMPTPVRYVFMFLVTGLLMWTILHFFDLV